jgi:hypothetical protein
MRSISPKSETAEAIRYALLRSRALKLYVDDGRIEIDNSAGERALRAVARGGRSIFGQHSKVSATPLTNVGRANSDALLEELTALDISNARLKSL